MHIMLEMKGITPPYKKASPFRGCLKYMFAIAVAPLLAYMLLQYSILPLNEKHPFLYTCGESLRYDRAARESHSIIEGYISDINKETAESGNKAWLDKEQRGERPLYQLAYLPRPQANGLGNLKESLLKIWDKVEIINFADDDATSDIVRYWIFAYDLRADYQ